MSLQKQRDANIELLRCLLMFGIVLLHSASHTGLKGWELRLAPISTSLSFCVDAFVLISGWYGIHFSWSRVGKFLKMGIAPAVVLFGLSFFTPWKGYFMYSLGWFGNAYLMLMFMCPLVNAGIEALREKGEHVFRMAWFAYAVAMVISWCPVFGCGQPYVWLSGLGWEGFSVNTLCFVYVTGRVLRGCEGLLKIPRMILLYAFVGLEGVVLCSAALPVWFRDVAWVGTLFRPFRNYNSLIVIFAAVVIFLFFRKVSVRGLCGGVVRIIAPSMFAVYLLHDACNPMVSRWLCFNWLENKLFPLCGGSGYVTAFFTAGLVFCSCLLLDLFVQMIFGLLWRRV